MRIYCDGNFDLFHAGHLRQLEALKSTADDDDAKLIVGVLSTEDARGRGHAEDPVWSLDQRTSLLRSLKCVDEVVSPCPAVPTESFLEEHEIDAVYHAFASPSSDVKEAQQIYAAPIALGIFHAMLDYNPDRDVPEVQPIKNAVGWSDVWERKGQVQDKKNVRLLTGYDETDFDPEPFAQRWLDAVKWCEGETVLDVGCGSGFLGDFLPREGYVGVEKSYSQTKVFIERSRRVVISQDAQELPFRDGAFDHVISHSMLEYMPGKEAACRAIREMQRVSRKTVFLGDLRTIQHGVRPDKYVLDGSFRHTLFGRDEFYDSEALPGFVVFDGWWGPADRFNAMHRKQDTLHLAIIGGGPAGCGLLTNHALNGEYEKLLDSGVAILESGCELGGGKLHEYRGLRSNSHGCAFFDAIKELGISAHDDTLDKKEEIPMTDMHKLQQSVGAWHEANLSRHHVSRSMTGVTVVSVDERPNGQYCIKYTRDSTGDAIHELMAINVCVCTGGKPWTPSWVVEQVDEAKLESADSYFKENLSLKGDDARVAIIGFSHTAFSLGDLLMKKHPSAKLTFIRRPTATGTMPSIYFPSTEAADDHPYEYKDVDVCPETKRVHRFGGVRGDGRTFALSHAPHNISTVLDPSKYDHVIVACGYQINAPDMKDRSGTPLVPRRDYSGTVTSSQGLLFPDHQIYAFGIGCGLPPSKETGGEPGCTRRSDGIWLYQYAAGSIVRNAINQRSTEWRRIYNRIGNNASEQTLLHHIGGYNMFSQEEWDNQVKMLVEKCGITNLRDSTPIFEGGVGGGAFVDSLHRLYGCEAIEGCDQASACIDIARKRLPFGEFWVGDASDLARIPDQSKEFSIMNGVTPYLNDLDHVRVAVEGLVRITKPGGCILVAENNDLEGKELAGSLRKKSHKLPSNHLFIPNSFWEGFPNAKVLNHHRDLGLKNPMAPYRNSVLIQL